MSKKLYGDSFYNAQIKGSYRSASIYVKHLLGIFKPCSVIDVGCGRGSWLKAFSEEGVLNLVGIDGAWNSQENIIDPIIDFIPLDLNKPLMNFEHKFDLAISLEVAEHLRTESSITFVRNIISLADIVMFGAAYKKQGGVDHSNEQLHSYWAKIFIDNDFIPYDIFRPNFWGNEEVEFWYQQNTFLYVKKDSVFNQTLTDAGHKPISNIAFMNCVHPQLYDSWVLTANKPLKAIIKKIIPRKLYSIAINFRKNQASKYKR